MKYTPQQLGEIHKKIVLRNPKLKAKYEREYQNMTRSLRLNSTQDRYKVIGLLEQKFLYPKEFIDPRTSRPYYLYLKCIKASYFTVSVNGPFDKMFKRVPVYVDGFYTSKYMNIWPFNSWYNSDWSSDSARLNYLTKQVITYKDADDKTRQFAKAGKLDRTYLTYSLRDLVGFDEPIMFEAEKDVKQAYADWYNENSDKFATEKFFLSTKNVINPKYTKVKISDTEKTSVVDPSWHLGHTIRALYSFMDIATSLYPAPDGVTTIVIDQITKHPFYKQYIPLYNAQQKESKYQIDLNTVRNVKQTYAEVTEKIVREYFKTFSNFNGYKNFSSNMNKERLSESFKYEQVTDYSNIIVDDEKGQLSVIDKIYYISKCLELSTKNEIDAIKSKIEEVESDIQLQKPLLGMELQNFLYKRHALQLKRRRTQKYTGLGTMNITDLVKKHILHIVKVLEQQGYTLRTGDFTNTDKEFAKNISDKTKVEIYGKRQPKEFQVLGSNSNNEIVSDFIIYYIGKNLTDDNDIEYVLDLADEKNIPSFNLSSEEDNKALINFLKILFDREKPKRLQTPEKLQDYVQLELRLKNLKNRLVKEQQKILDPTPSFKGLPFPIYDAGDGEIKQLSLLATNIGKNSKQINDDIKQLKQMKDTFPKNLQFQESYEKKTTTINCSDVFDVIISVKENILEKYFDFWDLYQKSNNIQTPSKIQPEEVDDIQITDLESINNLIERVIFSLEDFSNKKKKEKIWYPITVVIFSVFKQTQIEVKTYYNLANFLNMPVFEEFSRVICTDKIIEGSLGQTQQQYLQKNLKRIQGSKDLLVKYENNITNVDKNSTQIGTDLIRLYKDFILYKNIRDFLYVILVMKSKIILHLRELDMIQCLYDTYSFEQLIEDVKKGHQTYLFLPYSNTTYMRQTLSGKPMSIGGVPINEPFTKTEFESTFSNLDKNLLTAPIYTMGKNLS